MDGEPKVSGKMKLTYGSSDLIYREEDFEELLMTLMESTFKPDEIAEYAPRKRAYLKDQLEKPETVVLFDGDRMVGFAGLKMFESPNSSMDVYFEIKSLVVSKSYQENGSGKNIAAEVEAMAVNKARSLGKGCFLFCMTSNPRVQQLSLKNGYRQVPTRDWFAEIRPNEDETARNEEADLMEQEYAMNTYVKDAYCAAEAQKMTDTERATAEAVAPILKDL